jgi:hypothetical protein
MKTKKICRNLPSMGLVVALFLSLSSFAQSHTISGTVKDKTNGEDLIGVLVGVRQLPGKGTATNAYGFYSLTLPNGKYTFVYQMLGYKTLEIEVAL